MAKGEIIHKVASKLTKMNQKSKRGSLPQTREDLSNLVKLHVEQTKKGETSDLDKLMQYADWKFYKACEKK